MTTTNEIRSAFLNSFARNEHKIVSSSSLVPNNDPTLMFTNAGMVQFKNLFTGAETADYNRAVTSQKCVRAGGKHNDLENVGYTARHHTFFEMLGNFSFGDYFKDDAIAFAWDLVTKEYGLSKDKLLVTVYHEDEEAASLWKKVAGLSDDRIIRIATSDNFWQMGDTGPCGPCSEIFYDHGDHIWGGPPGSADEDGDRFIEIWNLVFMQFEQYADGTRTNLPKPSIDTGMGLERISALLQGSNNNYDIDTLQAIITDVAHRTGIAPDSEYGASHKVVADHLRATSFLIADGVMPSNEGRGYVLRRIMRRAMRHLHILGAKDPIMDTLVAGLVAEMGNHFTELQRAKSLIEETIKMEETRFKTTLDRGLKLLEAETADFADGDVLDGKVAFTLYDTYGFPLDLTQDILRGKNQSVDTKGFDTAMAEQKAKARKAWVGSGDAGTDQLWFDIKDSVGGTEFLGYETATAEGVVLAIVKEGQSVATATTGDSVIIIANQTPFYGESGGQVGDTGTLITNTGAEITIADTQKKLDNLFLHIGTVAKGNVAKNDTLDMRVNKERREKITRHHSVLHLLHGALHEHLGNHAVQKGSLCSADYARFDFANNSAVTWKQLSAISETINHHIRANTPVQTRVMSPDDAVEQGAMALFGEKYGDEVRVVSMGTPRMDNSNIAWSVELCGGIHVQRTGEIGMCVITSETSVSAGVRRVELLVGDAAERYIAEQLALVRQTADLLSVKPHHMTDRVTTLLQDRKQLERTVTDLKRKLATGGQASSGPDVETINGTAFIGKVLDGVSAKDLKPLADDFKAKISSGVVALLTSDNTKVSVVVGVTDDLTHTYNAVDLVRLAAEAVGGKGGGGRPHMAQAGGTNPSDMNKAITAVRNAL